MQISEKIDRKTKIIVVCHLCLNKAGKITVTRDNYNDERASSS